MTKTDRFKLTIRANEETLRIDFEYLAAIIWAHSDALSSHLKKIIDGRVAKGVCILIASLAHLE